MDVYTQSGYAILLERDQWRFESDKMGKSLKVAKRFRYLPHGEELHWIMRWFFCGYRF